MNPYLLKLLGQIKYSKAIPPNLPNEIEKECWKIQTIVDTKALEIPQELKQYAKHTFNQIGKRKNELEGLFFELQGEVKNGMDSKRLHYIDDQLILFCEIFATLDDLQIILLEHLIAYFPDEYGTELNRNKLKELHPHSSVLLQPRRDTIQKDEKETQFSVLQWVTIFYYAEETKLTSDASTLLKRMSDFMSKHNITTSPKSFRIEYYEAKKRINVANDYPINKLELIIPFLRKNYKQTVTKVENDIIFLNENNPEY